MLNVKNVSHSAVVCWASFAAGLYSPWFIALAVAALAWTTVESAVQKQLKLKDELDRKVATQNEAIKQLQIGMSDLLKAHHETTKQLNMLVTAKSLTAAPRVSAR